MSRYEIAFARVARKELEALETRLLGRIWHRIQMLGGDPHPPGCRKIQGEKNLWRIRVGDYRVLYEVIDRSRTIDIIAIRHRRDAYR